MSTVDFWVCKKYLKLKKIKISKYAKTRFPCVGSGHKVIYGRQIKVFVDFWDWGFCRIFIPNIFLYRSCVGPCWGEVLRWHEPPIVLFQETGLSKSTTSVKNPAYETAPRRDRKATDSRGGIVALQRQAFNGLIHITHCVEEERSWHFPRLEAAAILLGS